MQTDIRIVECPRDAMQGLHDFIPTHSKIEYLNSLLKVGFDTLDCGSFVSPKAVPQMADTAEVLAGLQVEESHTKLLVIVANRRGAEDACAQEKVGILGYPFSISDTFQQRNTGRSLEASVPLVDEIFALAKASNKELVIYLSMGFGNPYGDPWSPDIAAHWAAHFAGMGVRTIALADTVGTAKPEAVASLFETLIPRFPEVTFGAHFHASPDMRLPKIKAAWDSGCRRFDSAMLGFGGCPFAEDELVGNIATESLLDFCAGQGIQTGLDAGAFAASARIARTIF
ncbi:MAG: hydroxymethylglutaryl-CoA lyase [Bacteroidia bacterium]